MVRMLLTRLTTARRLLLLPFKRERERENLRFAMAKIPLVLCAWCARYRMYVVCLLLFEDDVSNVVMVGEGNFNVIMDVVERGVEMRI